MVCRHVGGEGWDRRMGFADVEGHVVAAHRIRPLGRIVAPDWQRNRYLFPASIGAARSNDECRALRWPPGRRGNRARAGTVLTFDPWDR